MLHGAKATEGGWTVDFLVVHYGKPAGALDSHVPEDCKNIEIQSNETIADTVPCW